MAGFQPNTWGGENNSKDYEPFMQGDSPVAKPISLVGHAFTAFNADLLDPVDIPVVRKVRGKIRNFVKRIRAAQQTSLTFTMIFGSTGAVWTPALHRARRGTECETTFYAKRLCPDNPEWLHAWIFPDAILNPPTRVGDFITIEDTVMADFQAEVRVEEELLLWQVGGSIVLDGQAALNAVAFMTSDCVDCDETEGVAGVATGGDGDVADPLIVLVTEDRFATVDVISTPGPAGSVGEAIYTDGNVVLIGFSDGAGVATATTGGTLISGDRGQTFQLDGNITEPVYAVNYFNGQYIAAGGTGAGAALMWTSDDGVTWEAVVSGVLPGALALTSLAVDNERGFFYVVGEGGTVLKGYTSAGSIVLVALTPPGSPGTLNQVSVFGDNHIAVAGASGYYAESFDGGVTWVEPTVPGSTAITAMAGMEHRSLLGVTTSFMERSFLTDLQYETHALENGETITGTVQDIAMAPDDFNLFAAVTDGGEVVVWKAFFPNA